MARLAFCFVKKEEIRKVKKKREEGQEQEGKDGAYVKETVAKQILKQKFCGIRCLSRAAAQL